MGVADKESPAKSVKLQALTVALLFFLQALSLKRHRYGSCSAPL